MLVGHKRLEELRQTDVPQAGRAESLPFGPEWGWLVEDVMERRSTEAGERRAQEKNEARGRGDDAFRTPWEDSETREIEEANPFGELPAEAGRSQVRGWSVPRNEGQAGGIPGGGGFTRSASPAVFGMPPGAPGTG